MASFSQQQMTQDSQSNIFRGLQVHCSTLADTRDRFKVGSIFFKEARRGYKLPVVSLNTSQSFVAVQAFSCIVEW